MIVIQRKYESKGWTGTAKAHFHELLFLLNINTLCDNLLKENQQEKEKNLLSEGKLMPLFYFGNNETFIVHLMVEKTGPVEHVGYDAIVAL